ncbi:MAG: D-alanyl-D-alanine carboxypeptidase family protein [bacterium]
MKFIKISITMIVLLILLTGIPVYAQSLSNITAKSAVVIEYETGKVIFAKNSEEKRAPASTTKIMTALVALDEMGDQLDILVPTSEKAATIGESSIWLVKGEVLSLEDMLYGLLLNSGNDAAVAIAEKIGGSEAGFVQMMNAKAKSLGAKNTHFANPNGLPNKDHYTTAADLAKITRCALHNPIFSSIVATKTKEIIWENHEWNRQLINTNKLLWHLDGANGVKTGYTEDAGHCLVSSAKRGDQQFICVVLNSANIWEDSKNLLEYAFANYKKVDLYDKGQAVAEAKVDSGLEDKLKLITQNKVSVVVPKDNKQKIKKKFLIKENKKAAPIKKGEVIGRMDILLDGKIISQENLMADRDVHSKTLMRSFINQFWGLFCFMIKNFG